MYNFLIGQIHLRESRLFSHSRIVRFFFSFFLISSPLQYSRIAVAEEDLIFHRRGELEAYYVHGESTKQFKQNRHNVQSSRVHRESKTVERVF